MKKNYNEQENEELYNKESEEKDIPFAVDEEMIQEIDYEKMHEKNLISGSRWVNWLSEKFDELMDLDDNASNEEYQKIYKSIESQIKELEYHKSFL